MRRQFMQALVTGGLVAALAAVSLARGPHPLTAANERAGLRLSKRTAIHDDPGVLAIVGRRAHEIRRVWFGDVESVAVAASAIGGVGAAIPPGEAGERVDVRVLLNNGTERVAGRFAYGSHLTIRGRLGAVGHGAGCSAPGPSGREVDRDAMTLSRVRRVARKRYRYTYRIRNHMADDVTFTWPALQFLGLADEFVVTVPAGETLRIVRESSSPPVRVLGLVTTSAMPGCLPNGDTEGDAWPGTALLPRDALPTVAPPTNVQMTIEDGRAHLTWTPPSGEAIDVVEVTQHELHPWRDVFNHGRRWRNHIVHGVSSEWVPAEETTFRSRTLEDGVTTFSLRSVRNGVRSAPVHVHAVR